MAFLFVYKLPLFCVDAIRPKQTNDKRARRRHFVFKQGRLKMMNSEIWKDVGGYEGTYQVSNFGRVKRIKDCRNAKIGHILKPHKVQTGYDQICLCKNGIERKLSLDRIVAEAFIGSRPDGKQINHKDGNRQNNCVDNLEWVTPSENMKHAYRVLGKRSYFSGLKSHSAKLSNQDISRIRELYASGKYSQKKIAIMYGASESSINSVVNNKRNYSPR